MADEKSIKLSFERQGKAVGLRPSLGQRTVVSKARMADGLKCEVEEGPWKLTADMAEEGGGEGSGAYTRRARARRLRCLPSDWL